MAPHLVPPVTGRGGRTGLVDQSIGTLGGQEPITRWAREEANVDHLQASDFAPWKA